MNTLHKYKILIILPLLILSSCDNGVENPDPPNEEEVITTIILTFSPVGGGADIEAIWRDEDGDGGNPPSRIDDIALSDADDYTLSVEFLNESDPMDVEDITLEIEDEADDHQLFFTGTSVGSIITYTYSDTDINGNPIGLEGMVSTDATGTGIFRVTLKHQPDIKDATTGINDGETDIEVDLNMEVL